MNESLAILPIILLVAIFGGITAAIYSKKGSQHGTPVARILVWMGVLAALAVGLLVVFFLAIPRASFSSAHVAPMDQIVMDRQIEAVLAPKIQLGSPDSRVVRVRVPRGSAPRPTMIRVEQHTIRTAPAAAPATAESPVRPEPPAAPKSPAEAADLPESPPAVNPAEPAVDVPSLETVADLTATTEAAAVETEPTDVASSAAAANNAPSNDDSTAEPAESTETSEPPVVADDSGTTVEAAKSTDVASEDAESAPAAELPANTTADSTAAALPDTTTAAPADAALADAALADTEEPKPDGGSKPPSTVSIGIAKSDPIGAPAWLKQTRVWKDGVFSVVLVSDPKLTVRECEQQLDTQIRVLVAEFAESMVGRDEIRNEVNEERRQRRATMLFKDLDLTIGQVRSATLRDSFVEDYFSETIGRTMMRVHLLLEADEEMQKDIQQRWNEYDAARRARNAEQALAVICVVGVAILAVLAAIYGLLRFDTATKGYYTKRLLLGAGAVTIFLMLLALFAD